MAHQLSSSHDIGTVRRAIRQLSEADLACWVFGGWAEELRGMCAARPHTDIDLLLLADDFAAVDVMLHERGLTEVKGKRFPHKRAFLFEGVMVELFLVQTDDRGFFTSFRNITRHDWPSDVFSDRLDPPTASVSALTDYRRDHDRLTTGDFPTVGDGPLSSGSGLPARSTELVEQERREQADQQGRGK
jgi:hypothetical protein